MKENEFGNGSGLGVAALFFDTAALARRSWWSDFALLGTAARGVGCRGPCSWSGWGPRLKVLGPQPLDRFEPV